MKTAARAAIEAAIGESGEDVGDVKCCNARIPVDSPLIERISCDREAGHDGYHSALVGW